VRVIHHGDTARSDKSSRPCLRGELFIFPAGVVGYWSREAAAEVLMTRRPSKERPANESGADSPSNSSTGNVPFFDLSARACARATTSLV
jgi:hypothetical protein